MQVLCVRFWQSLKETEYVLEEVSGLHNNVVVIGSNWNSLWSCVLEIYQGAFMMVWRN